MSDATTSQQTTEQPGSTEAATTTQPPQGTQGSATTTDGSTAGDGTTQQTATAAPTTEEGGDTTQERDEKGRFKGVQPRIDELTRRRHEAEREAAYWRAVAEGKAQPSGQAPATKPTPDQYDNYADFVEALADFKADEKVTKALAQRSAQTAQQTAHQTFQGRVTEFIKATPDYVDVVGNSDTPVAGHVAEHIQDPENELGPALAYHLAKNPDVAHRLNAMSPVAAGREIGRIEATLAKAPSAGTPPPAPAKKLTQAPEPASTTTTGQGRATKPAIGELPMKDYIAERAKQGARWAR
jgi:hypothetical protein